MELYPAIDLRRGTAVRLTQGDFERQTAYGDPLALAEEYVAGGATWIHVVDLEAARTGTAHERRVVDRIVARVAGRARVQLGGGIRSEDAVAAALGRGVARVVLGTAALADPSLAVRCARRWPGRVAVGLDYRIGPDGVAEAQGHGWSQGAPRAMAELLACWEGEPVGAVVATAIARDGTLEGPDLDGLRSLLASTSLPVIASGGVGTMADLSALARLVEGDRRVAGAITGKALAERRFSVEEALAACAPSV